MIPIHGFKDNMPQSRVIIVSGFAGSGKSTLAEKLAIEFNLPCVHASDILRQLARKKAEEIDTTKTTAGSGWWESEEAKEYMKKRMSDGSLDKELDRMLLAIIDKGNVVMDSWAMPWLSKKGCKIWLNVAAEERAKRVSERDKLPYSEVLKKIKSRDEKTAEIYKKLYGFELGKDLSPFNLVIDAAKSPDEVFAQAKKGIEKIFQRGEP